MHFGSRRRSPTTRKRARIAATLAVAAAAWLAEPAWTQAPPTISAVDFTSDPGTDRRYGVDDEIVATITFSEVVHVFEGEVSGVQHGQLHLLLTVGANTRQAQFCAGSGSTMLQFCYRVAGGDEDTDGVSIGNLGSALVGGVIQSATGTDATRTFNAIASDANHRVDGVAPAVARDNRGFHRVGIASDAGADNTYGFGEAIEIEITFNEIVSVLGEPAIILTIGENSRRAAFRGGSGTHDLRFRYLVRADDRDDDGINIGPGTDAGGSQLAFVGGTITDLAGNAANRRFDGLAADPAHMVDGGMDVDPPAVVVDGVAITSAPGNYAAGEFIEITVTFDEPVHVSGNPTVALRVGAADRTAALVDGGNGRAELRFRYRVQPGEEDGNGVAIPANALALNGATIEDRAGNAAQLLFPSPGRFPAHRVAAIAPFVRSVAFTSTPSDGATYQAGESIIVQVAFEDPGLTVSGAPTLELAIGNPPNRRMALQRATGGVLVFTYTVRAGDVDNDGIDIPAGPDTLEGGTLRDQAGNLADRAFSAVRANHDVAGGSDTVAPSVRGVTIASRPENSRTYLSGERITLAVTFDEPVQVAGAPTMPIRVGAVTRNATASAAVETTRLLFHYAIQNGDADADGISVEAGAMLGGAAIEDRSGNAANPALPQLPDQPAHRVDATPPAPTGSPTIASTPRNGTAYEAGEVIRATLSFGEAVRVDGEPTLTLVVGANDRTMRYQGGSGTAMLSFAYTVLPGEMDTNGVSLRRDALSLNGGTLRDAVGNNAVLTHAALADDASHQVDGGADLTPPSIEQVLVEDGPTVLVEDSKFFAYGDEIPVVVVFDEPVFVTGDPTVTIEIGGQPRTASYHGGSGTERLTFRYRMDAIDNGGIIVRGDALRLNGATLQDGAGNDAETTHRPVWYTCCRADGVAPRVETVELISNAGLDNVYKRGEAIAACVTFTEPIVVAHAPNLTLGIRIGDNTRRAEAAEAAQSCAADHQIAFEYTVQASDQDRDGVHIDPGALAGGGITDHVGNSADLRRLVLPTQPDHRVDGNAAGATASIVSDPGDDNTYAAGDEIRVRVDLLRASDGMEGNLVLTIGNLDREATLESRRPSQLTYIYTVQPGDEDTDGISIRANALRDNPRLVPIENAAGHRVDAVPPGTARLTIASDPGADETYAVGDAIEVHVVFNEPVWVDAVPRLRLAIGRRTPAAAYRSGSGSTTLRFRYIVQSGDFDDDGIDIGANALIDGTIADGAGNELDAEGRRLAPLLAQSGHKVDAGNDETDEQPPRIDCLRIDDCLRITSKPQVGDTYATGETIEVQVIFSEAVNVLEVGVVGGQQVELERPVLQLELGCGDQTVSRSARLAPEDDASDTLTFRYTTVAGDCDDDGVSIPANALTGGSIVDYSTAANEAIRTHGALSTSHKVDAVAPRPTRDPWFTSRPHADSYGVGEAITVQVAFAERIFVSGQPTLRLNIGNATKDALFTRVTSQDNVMEFQYVVQSGDGDDDGVSIAPDALSGGRIQDAVGNAWSDRRLPALASDSRHRVYGGSDNLPPVVTATPEITSNPTSGDTYGIGETIRVKIVFSEVVHVSGQPALALSIGANTRQALYASGSGSPDRTLLFAYIVQAGDFDDDGISIGPSALAGGTIQDGAGNAATLTFRGLPAQPGHTVNSGTDLDPPVVISGPTFKLAPGHDGIYHIGETIQVEIEFNEVVHVSGRPALALSIGANTRQALYASGSGSATLQFRYIVQAGDADDDGISIGPGPAALTGGDIRDGSGNAALREFAAVPRDDAHEVDGVAPRPTGAPTIICVDPHDRPVACRPRTYGVGETIQVEIVFSEVVHVSGQPALALSIGANTRQALYASGSGSATLQFRYIVQAGDADDDGISIGPGPAALTGGDIRDGNGNAALREFPAVPKDDAHQVDGVAPAVTATPEITSSPANGDTYGIGELVEVEVVFDDDVQTTGDVVLALRVGATFREAALASDSGSNTLTFRYAVQEGDLDEDGVSVAADALRGGEITDSVGNPATRGLPPLGPQLKHKVDGVRATATVAITSSPASGDTYRAGENITAAVTFSEPVREPSATGLRLTLTIGSAARAAAFVGRNDEDERTLAFRYTVAYGDIDADGVSVEGDALTGGAVTDLAGNPAQSAIALANQAGHKVDTSVTLELNAIALTVGGAPAQINLTTVLDYTGLYNAPTTSDANVAVARVSGHRLTITPVAEGNAVVTIAAQSTAEIVLNIPVVVTASPAEIAVLKQTLAAMGRGMFASAAHTIGSRLELGPGQRRMSLLVGGRRFDPQDWEQSPDVWPPSNVGHAAAPAAPGHGLDVWPGDFAAGAHILAHHGDFHSANAPLGGGFAPRNEQMWRGTGFEMPLLGGRGRSGAWSLWGGGDFSSFAGEPGDNAFDGSLSAMYIGMDGRGPGWVAGGAVGRISADASYEYNDVDTAGKGNLETSLTTFHPYVGWSFSDKAKAWVVAGFGTGEASMRREGAQYDATPTDLTMRMGLVGARGVLSEPGGFDIAVRADAGTLSLETGSGAKAIDDLAVAVQRVRLGVELSYTADNAPVVGGVRLAGGGGGGSFTPFVEVAARFDGGDEQSGTGAEVAAGVRYQGPTVSFEAKARTLAMHEAEGYSETGASATLVVSPRGNDGRGLRLSVSPRWGGTAEATDAFFQRDYAARAAQRHNAGTTAYDEWRANARVEYGMGLRGRTGTVTPFAETDVGGAGGKRARLGFSYETKARHGAPVRVNVSSERVQDARGTEHRLLIGAEGRF